MISDRSKAITWAWLEDYDCQDVAINQESPNPNVGLTEDAIAPLLQ